MPLARDIGASIVTVPGSCRISGFRGQGMSKSGAVGYFRVSTAEQSNQNNSLPTQESKFNNFCISNGLTVAKIFTDKQSARTDARPEFQKMLTMKTSITEETARIEETIKSLDAEKSSYTDLMRQAEAEVISFEKAWREGGIHRKRELQNALFPEGLSWWIKRKVFETRKGLSIDELGTVFDTLGLVGVPGGI